MNKLPEKFTKRGFTFTLIRRSERTAVYSQQWNGKKNASIAYEVIRPRIQKTRFIDGSCQECEPYETYPSSENWGTNGWTFTNEDEALAKFALLCKLETRQNRFDGSGG